MPSLLGDSLPSAALSSNDVRNVMKKEGWSEMGTRAVRGAADCTYWTDERGRRSLPEGGRGCVQDAVYLRRRFGHRQGRGHTAAKHGNHVAVLQHP